MARNVMKMTAVEIDAVLKLEWLGVQDSQRRSALASLLIAPECRSIGWDYGEPDERYDCWVVGRSPNGDLLLVYCDQGFGPVHPWGFIFPDEDSMGMDSQWHSSLVDVAIGAGLLSVPPDYEVP